MNYYLKIKMNNSRLFVFFLNYDIILKMKIKKIRLLNFRSYKNKCFEFDNKLNILVGPNAQGKTNVLEAIFYAVIGKSFRTSKEKELITWSENEGRIEAVFDNNYREIDIEVIFHKDRKKTILVDKVGLHKIGELLGRTNAVFFSPNELKLVKESPEDRRKFLNIAISQTNKRYFYLLARYEKILMNRNKLLKSTYNIDVIKETIDIWDRALCEIAEKIYIERKAFVDELYPYALKAHEYLSNGSENLKIEYKSDFHENYKQNMLKYLQKNIEKDFKLGFTSVGVHRDDLNLYVNDVEVKNFGSQGQQRTVALSLKLAELECNKNRTGQYPILLLDDVFSELDEERRHRLLNFTSKTQTIITCTDFNEKIDAKIIRVKEPK